jgi:hypothetical protein
MSYDLEYFTEFLNDPSVPDIADFYDMVNKWGTYISEHKGEFDYLADDEWKEIRERLIAEFKKREIIKREIDAEWEKTCAVLDKADELPDKEVLKALEEQLFIIKTYQRLYRFTDEDIRLLEIDIENYSRHIRNTEIAEMNVRLMEVALQKSVADLDETLAKYQERTGKTPVLPVFRQINDKKGN